MDFYFSSRWIETEHAQDQYSEELVLLDTLLSYQLPAPTPDRVYDRNTWGLESEKHLYLCAQHLGKFHPEFDQVLAGILRSDPNGEIVITGGSLPTPRQQLEERFRTSMPDVADRIRFIPRQSGDRYYSLLMQADVLLDPWPFGGVNTTYDGLSFGKAVVTRPTSFNRGRYTQACLRVMGIDDCVVDTFESYIAKAIQIATDPQHRHELEERIRDNSGKLFKQTAAATELEQLFVRLAQRHQS